MSISCKKDETKQILGLKLVKINFITSEPEQTNIESLLFEQDNLVTINNGNLELSRPDYEEELKEFHKQLDNFQGGIMTFKSTPLSRTYVEQEIAKKSKEIGGNGWGTASSNTRDGYSSYRIPIEED